MLERYYAQRIAFSALEVAEGKPKKTLQTASDELQAYISATKGVGSLTDEACRDDLLTLFKHSVPGTGLEWRMSCLNESLGELHKGNFLLFAGRPDSGKTTLLLSEGTYMAQQVPPEKKILLFSNEEGALALKPRLVSSLLGVDRTTLESDPLRYWDDYVRLLGGDPDKILLIEKSNLSVTDIERWVDRENAGLILIDQLRKIHGFNDIKGIARTERIFNWGRELSKDIAPVITVTQLDGEAENVAYPSMSRLYESKTAVQGEMDAIITIGRVDGSVPANARYIGMVKNKMPRPGDEAMRHAKHEVTLLSEIGEIYLMDNHELKAGDIVIYRDVVAMLVPTFGVKEDLRVMWLQCLQSEAEKGNLPHPQLRPEIFDPKQDGTKYISSINEAFDILEIKYS